MLFRNKQYKQQGVHLKKACCCPICKVAGLLVVVGAINWGLIGALDKNIVSALLGSGTTAEKIVYILVGVAGIAALVGCIFGCPMAKKCCEAPSAETKGDCGHKH